MTFDENIYRFEESMPTSINIDAYCVCRHCGKLVAGCPCNTLTKQSETPRHLHPFIVWAVVLTAGSLILAAGLAWAFGN